MNFPQIRLQSTNAQIEIYTQKGNLEMEQPAAELSIQQPPAEMQIDRKPSRLTIDQTQARADVDLKSIFKRTEEVAQFGRQDWLNGIARRAQEGEELMKIENKGNPIAEQAKRHVLRPEHQFNIGWIPSAGSVKISYDPGKVDIHWKVNKPIVESKYNKTIINYTPAKVDVQLKQYPSLQIDFANLKYVGIHYEQTI